MIYCKSTSDCDKNQWCNNKKCKSPPNEWTPDFYKDSIQSLKRVPLSQFNFKEKQKDLRVLSKEEATCIVDSIKDSYNPSEIYNNSQKIIDNIFLNCLHNEEEKFEYEYESEYESEKQLDSSLNFNFYIIISILVAVGIIILIVNTNSLLKRKYNDS